MGTVNRRQHTGTDPNRPAREYIGKFSEQADNYVSGRAAAEQSVMQLRLMYFPMVSGKTTALFFQMDWRVGLIIDLKLALQTPLIEP